jgi:tRNA pseudouridine55 synthase
MSHQSIVKPDPELVILIDKPLEWTSFGVVKKIKYNGKFRKIGHAGTLDPLATGLLILCTGKKTKQIESYQGLKKEYTGSMILGFTTESVDLETEPQKAGNSRHLKEPDFLKAFQRFTGEIQQTPPMHSAVKVNGQRAYKAARKGEVLALKSRMINIEKFELTKVENLEEGIRLSFLVHCSKGTYIRSLVRDVGEYLGCGAYMDSLRRTKIGDFDVSNALTPEEWVEAHKNENI